MSDKAFFLRDCLIIIAADDYENFELIFNQASRLGASKGFVIKERDVAEALAKAIKDGLLEAYDLSPHPPHCTRVEYSDSQLADLWYYVTPRGKELVRSIPPLFNGTSDL
jgi:hypothetical protein